MAYLLLPGRQIVNTRFQEEYLGNILGENLNALPTITGTPPQGKVTDIVFAVTSSNKSNSRYNPLPFETRAILVYEFCRELKARHGVQFHIVGIPHYGPTERFAAIILKEIAAQTEGRLSLTPQNTVVFTSTPSVIHAYGELGFSILPGEYDTATKQYTAPVPNEIVKQIGEGTVPIEQIARATRAVFQEMPDVPARIVRLYHDPILTEQGDLTETRNYGTYTQSMSDIVELKYAEIKDFLSAGKIIDEGCADGALLRCIVRDYPDSDLIGVDLSAEMLARANEAKREGLFGGAFVFFAHRNLMTPISDAEANTADTVICNSTLHELWSYGDKAASVRGYLRGKYKQLRPGGRLVIRDVVGPDHGDTLVQLECRTDDGLNFTPTVAALSTRARFLKFVADFARGNMAYEVNGSGRFVLPLRDAMEFIAKMDYTDNWASEMHEEFCFWDFPQWQRELAAAGFHLMPASHAYVNQWRVAHSFQPRVSLYALDGNALPFPVTNMILVGEKQENIAAKQNE